jgi:hypothetical protein
MFPRQKQSQQTYSATHPWAVAPVEQTCFIGSQCKSRSQEKLGIMGMTSTQQRKWGCEPNSTKKMGFWCPMDANHAHVNDRLRPFPWQAHLSIGHSHTHIITVHPLCGTRQRQTPRRRILGPRTSSWMCSKSWWEF